VDEIKGILFSKIINLGASYQVTPEPHCDTQIKECKIEIQINAWKNLLMLQNRSKNSSIKRNNMSQPYFIFVFDSLFSIDIFCSIGEFRASFSSRWTAKNIFTGKSEVMHLSEGPD